jgi:hypothetical protein
MRIARGLIALAVGLAGLGLMGAAPAPAPAPAARAAPPLPVTPLSRDALMARMLPAPRLFKMETTTGSPPTTQTTLTCMSAQSMRENMLRIEALRAARPAQAPASSQGCTRTRTVTADGWLKVDLVCDKAKGAARTSHMTNESRSGAGGEMGESRARMEMQTEVGGVMRTQVVQSHTTVLGPCSADLKPGQMRGADGKVIDLGAADAVVVRPPAPKS